MEDERLKREKKNRLSKREREEAKIMRKADKKRSRRLNNALKKEDIGEY